MSPNIATHNNSSVFTLLLYLKFHPYTLQHKTSNADMDINSKFDQSNSSQAEMTALCTM